MSSPSAHFRPQFKIDLGQTKGREMFSGKVEEDIFPFSIVTTGRSALGRRWKPISANPFKNMSVQHSMAFILATVHDKESGGFRPNTIYTHQLFKRGIGQTNVVMKCDDVVDCIAQAGILPSFGFDKHIANVFTGTETIERKAAVGKLGKDCLDFVCRKVAALAGNEDRE